MYSSAEYRNLTLKYGSLASWAIWDYKKPCDTEIIHKNQNQLHSKFVLLGLNTSSQLSGNIWQNFHGNTHDRKIKYACNDTKLRGSYITDIFKDIPEANSSNLKVKLTEKIIDKNVKYFIQEMKDIKLDDKTQFVIFGTQNSFLIKCFDKYFKPNFKNKVIYYYHYAYYKITDRDWVKGFWKQLYINGDVDFTINKYKQ
jgi:hypothetical protein